MQNNEEKAIAPIEIIFQSFKLTCPIEEGHRMVPVRTICDIIDVDFKTQDSWLKEHPFFGQLYSPSPTVGGDNKERTMNCLSIFDVDGWLHSLQVKGRKPGSVEKQYAFLTWLRERKLELYKSVEVFIQENEDEKVIIDALELKEQSIAEMEQALKLERQAKKELETELKQVRKKKYKSGNPNQTMLALE